MKVQEILAIADALPGMVLAEPVIDEMGRVLVPGGGELTESILRSLARREVAELKIIREVEEDPALREAYRAKLIEQLNPLFRKAGDGQETRLLYQCILDFRMEHRS